VLEKYQTNLASYEKCGIHSFSLMPDYRDVYKCNDCTSKNKKELVSIRVKTPVQSLFDYLAHRKFPVTFKEVINIKASL
jgi:hypothetical protein